MANSFAVQIMERRAYIDPLNFMTPSDQAYVIERTGVQMIDDLRRQLPIGATVINTDIQKVACYNRVGFELIIQITYKA